jgi:hypothetical protein
MRYKLSGDAASVSAITLCSFVRLWSAMEIIAATMREYTFRSCAKNDEVTSSGE